MKAKLNDLLIDPTQRWVVTDKGIDWVTDRYALARADLFRATVTPRGMGIEYPQTVSWLRKTRTAAVGAALPGKVHVVAEKVHRPKTPHYPDLPPLTLVGNGRVSIGVNAAAWKGWSATGLRPQLSHNGYVLWWRDRGKRSIFCGLIRCMHITSLDGIG